MGTIPDRFADDPRFGMADAHEYLERRRISRRRLLQGGLALAAGAVAGPTLWRQPVGAADVAAGGVHLTYGPDPATTMAVTWSTPADVANPLLDLGLDGAFGAVVPAETRAVAGTTSRYHHAVLTGLQPGTPYRFRVRHDGLPAPLEGTLATAPAPTNVGPFTFTAFGDQGVGADAVATTTQALAQKPAFHLHAGDLCYAYSSGNGTAGPTDQAVWDRWFAQVAPLASKAPWMPAVGNHEMEAGYGPQGYGGFLSRFSLPANGPSSVISTFRYGNVAVLNLDGNDASNEFAANRGYTAGAQDAWIAATLAAYRADPTIDFVVAQFHHCSYCTNAVHASDGGVRDRWSPLFDRFAVDLVINGHNHCYERTHPLKAGAVTAEVADGGTVDPATQGTTYITAGGGGQAAYQAALFPASYVTNDVGARVPEQAPWSATRYLDVSLLAVDVRPPGPDGVTTMTLRAITPQGAPIETVTLRRVRPVTPAVAGASSPVGSARPAAGPAAEAATLPVTGASTDVAVAAGTAVVVTGVALAARALVRQAEVLDPT